MYLNSLFKLNFNADERIMRDRKIVVASCDISAHVLAYFANMLCHGITKPCRYLPKSWPDSEEDEQFKKPYYSAYADILLEFKKENAVAYRAALQRLNLIRQHIDNTTVGVNDTIDGIRNQQNAKPERGSSQIVFVKPKILKDIMNTRLLWDKSWAQIARIWYHQFAKRDETLVAIIPYKEFMKMYSQFLHYPMFILQLSRENGQRSEDEFIFMQFECFEGLNVANCTVRLTPVNSYKTYGENAPECMTVEYYTDICAAGTISMKAVGLVEESFVLMRATYDGKLLSSSEAKCLINLIDCFYQNFCEMKEWEKLLRLFNKDIKPFINLDAFASMIEEMRLPWPF